MPWRSAGGLARLWSRPLHEVAGAGLEQSGRRWRDGAVSEIYGAALLAHGGMGRMAVRAVTGRGLRLTVPRMTIMNPAARS